MTGVTRLLFVCSRNQWRSPTAEAVWRKHPGIEARSAGTSPSARHPVSARDLEWADVIFVMEPKHKQRLMAEHVLDIPDDYRYMDPELVELVCASVSALLDLKRL